VVSDAFCASRLGGDWGAVLGTLPVGSGADKIVERASVPTA
jgi:putative acyl-CoA dehydrogenase